MAKWQCKRDVVDNDDDSDVDDDVRPCKVSAHIVVSTHTHFILKTVHSARFGSRLPTLCPSHNDVDRMRFYLRLIFFVFVFVVCIHFIHIMTAFGISFAIYSNLLWAESEAESNIFHRLPPILRWANSSQHNALTLSIRGSCAICALWRGFVIFIFLRFACLLRRSLFFSAGPQHRAFQTYTKICKYLCFYVIRRQLYANASSSTQSTESRGARITNSQYLWLPTITSYTSAVSTQ